MNAIIKKIFNRLIMKTTISRILSEEGVVYLTFDDGPEPGITEFVLAELRKYEFKATFFCKGENAVLHPELMEKIKVEGHSIGNHTYSHIKAYELSARDYVKDVLNADTVLHTHIFRPPNGCLTLGSWLKIRNKFNIYYWTIGSGDWCKESFDYVSSMENLHKTKAGDIILFHFSNDLQMGTRKLLPDYLKWLRNKGFVSKAIIE